MFTKTSSFWVANNKMKSMPLERRKKYLQVLWVIVFITLTAAPFLYYFENSFSETNIYSVVFLIFMVPIGVAYLSLLIDVFKRFGLALFLIFVPLSFFPRFSLLVVCVFPFFYLVFLTVEYFKIKNF